MDIKPKFRDVTLSLPGSLLSSKRKTELYERRKNNEKDPIKLSAAFPEQYTKAGYLDIRRDENKQWKRRYFVLNNNFLLCASTPHAKKLEAVIPLEGSNTNTCMSDMTFQLKQRKQTLYFRSPSPKENKIWTQQIQKASCLKIKDIYRFLFTLGTSESQMTKVVAAKHRTTSEDCAIKIVDKRTCDRRLLNTEIKILKKLKNQYIVNLHDIFETRKYLYIVMEKCEGGELFDQIANLDGGSFNEYQCCNVIYQVSSGMRYMHDCGIVHRDLKPENILCVFPNSIQKVKLADFGISKIVKNNAQQMKTMCGTLSYSAPEILRGKGYDRTIDYWSIGVIMYILLCGYPPFYGETENEISHSILKDEIEFDEEDWEHVSKSVQELVAGLLNRNPKQRKTTDDIIKITWKIISAQSIQNLSNQKAFPKNTKLKFQQTVIKRKIFRKSMGVFEKSSKVMTKLYNNDKKINNTNSKQGQSTDDMFIKTRNKNENYLLAPNQPSSNTKNVRQAQKANAFAGRRGSKGLELLELQVPMTQRPSFVGQKKEDVMETITEQIDEEKKNDE